MVFIFGLGVLVIVILVTGIFYTLAKNVFKVIPETTGNLPQVTYTQYQETSLPIKKTTSNIKIDYSFN